MELSNRVIRTIHLSGRGLLAADIVGRLHYLDEDLRVIRSSPAMRNGQPFYALTATDEWIVGKDRLGTVARWRADNLDLTDVLDSAAICDPGALMPDEEPSIAIARGIAVRGDKVYVNNGYLQLLVIDLPTFRVDRIVTSPTGDVPIEWICTEHPTVHAVADKFGRLFLGSLDTLDFPKMLRLDDKNLHRVRYDRVHDRFWVTQDAGIGEFLKVSNGVVTVTPDGVVEHELRFASDDVECLEMSADGTRVWAGGFDGVLHVFDNTSPELTVVGTYGPFSHQVSDVTVDDCGALSVLTHDGELVRLAPDGTVTARLPFRRQCVWDLQPAYDDPGLLYAATDEGVAAVRVEFDDAAGMRLAEAGQVRHGRGFTRRVGVLPDGWVAITRDQRVVRCLSNGTVLWDVGVDGLIHTVAVSPDCTRVLVASNSGGIEFDATTGIEIARISINEQPLWASAYLPGGERVVATHSGVLASFPADAGLPIWTVDIEDYPKRMRLYDDALLVTGGGGVRELAVDGSGVGRHWFESMSNTCENAVVVGEYLYAVTYDAQIAAYHFGSGELIGLLENQPDIPKAIAAVNTPDGTPYLVVGGRSGFLTVFGIGADGEIARIRDLYLGRSAGQRAAAVGLVGVP